MTHPEPDTNAPTPDAGEASSDASGPGPSPGAGPPDALERRAFVRRMGSDAVRTAGSVLSLSRILTRSAAAAGQAVMGELEAIQVGNAADESASRPAPVDPADADTIAGAVPAADLVPARGPAASAELPAAEPAAEPAVEPAGPAPRPRLLLDDEQRGLLEGALAAVVAVNREGHPPQLTTATVLWDGETLRFATVGWSRRTTLLRADPRIGLLVEGPGDGRFVTVTGHARIVEGRVAAVRDAAWPLLLREVGDGGEAAADARWQGLLAADQDRAVIVTEPDQVLSGRR